MVGRRHACIFKGKDDDLAFFLLMSSLKKDLRKRKDENLSISMHKLCRLQKFANFVSFRKLKVCKLGVVKERIWVYPAHFLPIFCPHTFYRDCTACFKRVSQEGVICSHPTDSELNSLLPTPLFCMSLLSLRYIFRSSCVCCMLSQELNAKCGRWRKRRFDEDVGHAVKKQDLFPAMNVKKTCPLCWVIQKLRWFVFAREMGHDVHTWCPFLINCLNTKQTKRFLSTFTNHGYSFAHLTSWSLLDL